MNEIVDIAVRLGIGAVAMLVLIVYALIMKGFDRKFAAWLQARVGPPIRQPFYDVAKLWQKETVLPERAVPWAFNGAPLLAFMASLALLFFIPLGPVGGEVEGWNPLLSEYADLVLVIYLMAVPGLMMAIGGFSSGSPLSTVGAQREMVLMMSYELPLAVIILSMAWRLFNFDSSIEAFNMESFSMNPLWGEVGILGFVGLLILASVFFLIIPSELSKIPFDAPEAETEIGGGLLAEYSGNNLALFYLADAVKTVAFASLAVALFIPYNISPEVESMFSGLELSGWAAYAIDLVFWVVKVGAVYFLAVTVIRVGAARLKIDKLSWLYLVPLSILSIVGALMIYLDTL